MSLLSKLFQCLSFIVIANLAQADTSDNITAVLEKARLADKIPGLTYSVFNKKGIVAKGQTGSSHLAGKPTSLPLNVDTSIFRIASVSKLFTTLSVSQLIEAQALNRDSKLMDLKKTQAVGVIRKNEKPQRLAQWNKIQVHQLMSHQSGISKDVCGALLGFNSESLAQHSYPTLDLFYKNLTSVEFLYPPGNIPTHFKYSNLAANILARVVESYNPRHLSYSEYVTRSILLPLGMGSTYYDLPAARRSHMVVGYGSLLPDGTRTETNKALYVEAYDGSMGVATTAPNLALFGEELLKIIDGESKLLTQPDVIKDWFTVKSAVDPNTAFGSGPAWVVLPGESADNDLWFGHEGTGPGERAALLVNAERNLGVVIMFNGADANREKYVQLIISQLKIDHPEWFKEKVSLSPMATDLVAKARAVIKATPAPVDYTPPPYPAGLDVQKFAGKYFADLAGYTQVTYDAASGYLVFMGQKLEYETDKGEGHFRFPPVGGLKATNTNKEPVTFSLDQSGKVISFRAFNIAIFRRVEN